MQFQQMEIPKRVTCHYRTCIMVTLVGFGSLLSGACNGLGSSLYDYWGHWLTV